MNWNDVEGELLEGFEWKSQSIRLKGGGTKKSTEYESQLNKQGENNE